MQPTTGRILKSSEVEVEGCIRLDLAATEPGPTKSVTAGSPPARARLVEDHPDFAVIEVTCSCGQKTYLRCEYANPGTVPTGDGHPGEP